MAEIPNFKYDWLFHLSKIMTEDYNFDNCRDRKNTGSIKYNRYADSDILPMWVADMDFCVAHEITEAIRTRLEHDVFGYSYIVPASLNDLIVERMQRLYRWSIRPEWLVWIPGVVPGVNIACRSFGDSDTQVLSPAVVYPPIPEAPRLNDRQLLQVPMTMQNRRRVMDMEWLAGQSGMDNKMLLLCNPHNPGGSVYTRDELTRLAEIAEAQGLVIVSDEVHCDLILEQGISHIPIASLDDDIERRSITLMAASKTFNLAGLGCAFAIIPDQQLRQNFRQASMGIVSHVNLFGYIATQAAYEHGEKWHQQLLEYLRGNRDYLVAEINRIRGLKLDPVVATYLAWIDVSELELDNPHRFFEQAGVGMSPGRDFGDNGFMRLNFGCSFATLKEAVSRIRNAVNQYWIKEDV